MFAANAQFDFRTRCAALIDRDLDQLSHAFDIKADERVTRVNALVDIMRQETGGIVAANAQGCLRQVIGAKAKEASDFSNFISHQRGAGKLDHCAN